MNINPEQKKALIAEIVIGVVGCGLIFYFWAMLGKAEVENMRETLETVKADIAVQEKKLQDIADFERMANEEWDEIEARLAQLSERLPSTVNAPEFYKALRLSLEETGINTRVLETKEINSYTEYAEIPYSVAARGRYHEFGQFVNLIEENQRFMRVKTFELVNDENRPSLHPIEIGIATYKLEN